LLDDKAATALMIKQAKQTRLDKREQSSAQDSTIDYIRIADGETVVEDVENEPMDIDDVGEEYEEHKGSKISFGADSILNAEARRRTEFRDNLMDAYVEI
jgi:hypothetical protein